MPQAYPYRMIDMLQQLAELYPAHIWKEDFLPFPLAQQALSTTEQEALREKFEDVEREAGEDVHVAFKMLAKKLEAVVEISQLRRLPAVLFGGVINSGTLYRE